MKTGVFSASAVVASALLILQIALLTSTAEASPKKILFMLSTSTRSEHGFFTPLIDALANRGHEITVVTSDPSSASKVKNKNVTHIVPLTYYELFEDYSFEYSLLEHVFLDKSVFSNACHRTYENQEFKEKVLNTKFDMVLINFILGECFYGLAYKNQASLVLLQTFPFINYQVQGLGASAPSSIMPFPLGYYTDEMNFKERVLNYLADWGSMIQYELFDVPAAEAVYRKQLGQHYPGLQEIQRNASLVLVMTDPAVSSMRPLTPDIVEVGCVHCKDPKPLPKELEDFVSGAEDGFIYFSRGVTAANLSLVTATEQKLLRVFSKLKQRVLWKSSFHEPGVVNYSILFQNFFPQQDLLGHKNIRLYIAHGGLFSTYEAIYHAVPVLGSPAFFDQHANVAAAVKKGYALQVNLDTVDEQVLEDSMKRLIDDQRFKARATEISELMKDRLNSPIDLAVFHIERVLKHKGIAHLQNTNARKLNIFQLYSMDVIAFLLVVIGIVLAIMRKLLSFIFIQFISLAFATDKISSSKKMN